ncbi:MAG: hypothetical protein FJY65_07120 [Calditrichaeota bacterium]|nr:hypothetical protein [Calditrichota bacterium]
MDLLTDGKADALVRRVLCLAWFSADEGVRLAMSEFSGLIITFAISACECPICIRFHSGRR